MKQAAEHADQARRSVLFKTVFGLFTVALLVLNIYAWRADREAGDALQRIKDIDADRITTEVMQTRRQQGATELRYLIRSFRAPDMVDILRTSLESSGLDRVLVCEANRPWANATAYYLYAPQDGQTLTIDLIDLATSGKSLPPTTQWDKAQYETIDVPLVAGKLHRFAFGVDRIKGQNKFRVAFDDRDLYGVLLPSSRSASRFTRNANLRIALTMPNRFADPYPRTNFTSRLPLGQWIRLSEMSFGFGSGMKKQIAIRVHLRSDGPFSIQPTEYWDTENLLDLQWDSESKEYWIRGVKTK